MSNNSSCRACLRSTPEMVSLFEPYRNFTIAHFITSLTDIKIPKNQKNFPKHLCSVCLEELEVVLNFKNKCKDTDKYLKSLSKLTVPCESKLKVESCNEIKLEEADEVNAAESEFDAEPCESTEVKEETDNEIFKEDPNCEVDIDCDKEVVDVEDKLDTFQKPDLKSKEETLTRKPTFGTYYECHDCGEQFRTKCKLRVHWKRTHNYLTCEKCMKIFKQYHLYKNHSDKACVNTNFVRVVVEGKKRHFYCKKCDYDTYHASSIRIHSRCHTGEKNFSCDICGKAYSQLCSLYSHKESIHKLYRVEMTCHYCGKHVQGRDKCRRHLQIHKNTRFQCDICQAFIKRKSSLENHIKHHFVKEEKIPATCDVCGKIFAGTNNLRMHKQVIHIRTPHSCKLCKYQNKNIYILRKHEKFHFQENMLQCSLCYKFFDGEEKINRHMHVVHGAKTHFCIFCDRGFMKRYRLIHHQRLMHAEQFLSHPGPTYIRISAADRKKKHIVQAADNSEGDSS